MDYRIKLLLEQLQLTQQKTLSDFQTIAFNNKEFEFLMFKLISSLSFSFINSTNLDRVNLLLLINEEILKMINYFEKQGKEKKVKKKKKVKK